jgi:hypothetical protein
MPRSHRWEIKRKCQYIIADIENALELCDKLMNIYYPNYPDYYIFPQLWIDALKAMRESVNLFIDKV